MKNEVKKKYQLQRQNINQTGAAPIDISFSPLEERISAICNKQLLDGDENIREIGLSQPKSIETPAASVLKERNIKVSRDDIAGCSSEATPMRRSTRILSKRKSREVWDEDSDEDDLPGVPMGNLSAKRSYRSHNTQVDRAIALQEKQIVLLEKISEQCNSILTEIKKISGNSSN